MTEVSEKDRREILISILQEIKEICDKNNITYYLGYGTLLGAVRHQGFIPWDDDIDILMPRNDYIKFIKTCNSELFEVVCLEKNKSYLYNFAKASHNNTIVVSPGIENTCGLGLSVDIFPIDGVGNSFKEAEALFDKRKVLFGLTVASKWTKYVPGRSKSLKSSVLRKTAFILSRFFDRKKLLLRFNDIISSISYEDSEYVAVCMAPYQRRDIMPKSMYSDPKELLFEGSKYNVPSNYEGYLERIYGNYLELPPIEERVPLHTEKAFYL